MDPRHGLVFLLVLGAGFWLILSVLVAAAEYEVSDSSSMDNITGNLSGNFSNFTDSTDQGMGLITTVLDLWGSMFGVFPVWLQAILALILGALLIWVASTMWTAIGA